MRRPASGDRAVNVAPIVPARNGPRRSARCTVPLCKPPERRHSAGQQPDYRNIEMAFSLIDDSAAAIPITILAKDRLPAWLAEAPERERNWLTAIGFGADQGKLALMPDEDGRLGRVAVGFGQGGEAGAGIWALAGLPDALPEGSYRLENLPDSADPTHLALGWALATYAFTRYRATKATRTALRGPGG